MRVIDVAARAVNSGAAPPGPYRRYHWFSTHHYWCRSRSSCIARKNFGAGINLPLHYRFTLPRGTQE